MKTQLYLDHAATTPVDPTVFAAMEPYLQDRFTNPSSLYEAARETRRDIDTARASIARLLGAKPTEIIFTSGGTESINLAIQGVLKAHPQATWVTSAIEHDAVLAHREPMTRDGHRVTTVSVRPNGIVDTDAVVAAIDDMTVLVSLILANNEIGTIQPVAEVAKALVKIRGERQKTGNTLPLYFHTDACQAASYRDLSVTRLGVDLLSFSGSKIYGPKGSGVLYQRYGTVLEPIIYGGGQERERRSGTENVAGVIGIAKAFELVQARRSTETIRLQVLRDDLLQRLQSLIPTMTVNGEMKHRLPNNLNLSFPGLDGQTLVLYLDQAGILASTGSACSSSSTEPSHVLTALGRSNDEATASLRLTLGQDIDEADISRTVEVLPAIVERLRTINA